MPSNDKGVIQPAAVSRLYYISEIIAYEIYMRITSLDSGCCRFNDAHSIIIIGQLMVQLSTMSEVVVRKLSYRITMEIIYVCLEVKNKV
jgi:hypothetical protein